MTTPTHKPAPRPNTHLPAMTEALSQRLEAILAELVREHEGLQTLAAEHRSAISKLDAAALRDVTSRTGDALQRIARLEESRCRALGLAPPRLGEPARGHPSVRELANMMEGPRRERVLGLAERLKTLINAVRDRHAAIRQATDSLTNHMRGLMQQVSSELSSAKTYDPRGRVAPGTSPALAGVDVRS